MASLRTDYQDDVFSGERKYRMVNNSDGTVSFIDVTDYTQEGSTFGALDVNATNETVNQLAEDLGDISDASSVTGDDAFSKIATLKTDLGNKATAADVAGANAFAKIHQLNTDLSSVNAHLTDYVKIISFNTQSITFQADTWDSGDRGLSISANDIPVGYKPIGVVGHTSVNGSLLVTKMQGGAQVGTNSIIYRLGNARTSASADIISFYVLCIKTNFEFISAS